MKSLWFENSEGKERVIAQVANWQDVWKAIDNFIDECNQKKIAQSKEIYGEQYDESKVHLFKSYYSRVWNKNNQTTIDVGSHTEFFYIRPALPIEKNN